MTEINWPAELYKWEHIANVLRGRIQDGTYPAGHLLSEVLLMQEFDVARATVRAALAALRDEGLIVTRKGKGSIVRHRGDVLD